MSHMPCAIYFLVSNAPYPPRAVVPDVLRALHPLVPYVTRIIRALLLHVSRVLRTIVSHVLVPCVLLSFTCLLPYVFSCRTWSCASLAMCPMYPCTLRARFPYVHLVPRALHLCANITFCALEFPCLTLLFFYSFRNCERVILGRIC